jgi:large subunit ribosomal protein L15
MLTLSNLQKSKGSTHRRKKVGRGSGSGHGNYSTRGMKGQRSRSGGRTGLAARSMRSYLLRIPKNRGFRSIHPKYATVNVGVLNNLFKDGDKVNVRILLKKGLIMTIENGLKILSTGPLDKKLTIEASAFSATAKKKIEEAGGKAIVVRIKKEVPKDKK